MKKQDQKILNDLESAGEEKVLEAIRIAGDSGNDALIPVIISLSISSKNENIVNASLDLLRSIKSKALIPALIEGITNATRTDQKKKLTTICWESAQNCDPYLDFFVKLAINEPFEVALEAITVVEEMQGNVDLESARKAITDTEKAIAAQPDKASLLAALSVTLKNFVSSAHHN